MQWLWSQTNSCDLEKVTHFTQGFPGGSQDKASACNGGDLGSIPGSGRSPGEGNGHPLQHSCLENPMDRGAWRATVHGVARVGHDLVTKPAPLLHCSWILYQLSYKGSPFVHIKLLFIFVPEISTWLLRVLFLLSLEQKGFPCGSAGKESACNAGDLGSIPGLGRSPEEGRGYPFQGSGLENSMNCITHGVTKSWAQLSHFH